MSAAGTGLSPVRTWELELLAARHPALTFTAIGSRITAASGWGEIVAEGGSARELLSLLSARAREELMSCYPTGWPVRERRHMQMHNLTGR